MCVCVCVYMWHKYNGALEVHTHTQLHKIMYETLSAINPARPHWSSVQAAYYDQYFTFSAWQQPLVAINDESKGGRQMT